MAAPAIHPRLKTMSVTTAISSADMCFLLASLDLMGPHGTRAPSFRVVAPKVAYERLSHPRGGAIDRRICVRLRRPSHDRPEAVAAHTDDARFVDTSTRTVHVAEAQLDPGDPREERADSKAQSPARVRVDRRRQFEMPTSDRKIHADVLR
jgi:hypothetical protein